MFAREVHRPGCPDILAPMVAVDYHTDPACPWSWAAEPRIRALMVEFGEDLRWSLVMGGLARDVAPGVSPRASLPPGVRVGLMEEWLRVSAETGAPLDPLTWVEGGIRTTYPACMAVRAAAEQGTDVAFAYLRRLREGIMCERLKLDHAEALVEVARQAGLDVERFRLGLRSNAITEAFGADLEATAALAAEQGARPPESSEGAGGAALPTVVFASEAGRKTVAGLQPLDAYRRAAQDCGARRQNARPDVEEVVRRFGRVTTAEVELLCDLPGPRAQAELWRLAENWRVRPVRVLTGWLWEAA
jgi:predicted DsbA family dithiol-disulfide isomerase